MGPSIASMARLLYLGLLLGPAKVAAHYLLISDFARDGDMIIENEGTGGTRLNCRWCAVGCCYEQVDTRCGGWQAMKPWGRHCFGATTVT